MEARWSNHIRKPVFGKYGRWVVLGLCGWEIVGLLPGPVPTLSQMVEKYPVAGWTILGLLGHHWFVERSMVDFEHFVQEAVAEVTS